MTPIALSPVGYRSFTLVQGQLAHLVAHLTAAGYWKEQPWLTLEYCRLRNTCGAMIVVYQDQTIVVQGLNQRRTMLQLNTLTRVP